MGRRQDGAGTEGVLFLLRSFQKIDGNKFRKCRKVISVVYVHSTGTQAQLLLPAVRRAEKEMAFASLPILPEDRGCV